MKGQTMNAFTGLLLPLALGLLMAWIIFATLAGRSLPLISGPRLALIAVLIVGMAACALGGIGQVGASGHWAWPLAILGYLLGAAILLVALAGLFGWKLPLVASTAEAVAMAGVLIAAKYVIGLAGYFFHWL